MEIIANMELNKKVEVEILHVENPNKFWFRTKSDARDLDKAVSLYVSANSAKNSYTPKVDDVIVAKINCRWEIAHVKSKDNFIVISIVGKQKIWKITQKDAILLNDRSLIDMAVKTIQLGSISGIDPGEKEINDRLMLPELKKKLCWTQNCINDFTTILNTANAVYFLPTNRNIDCYMGELIYLREACISSLLLDMGYAKPQSNNGYNGTEFASANGSSIDQDVDDSKNNTASNSRELEQGKQPNLGSNVADSKVDNGMNHSLSPITERTEISDSSFNMSNAESSNSFTTISNSSSNKLSGCLEKLNGSQEKATNFDEPKFNENSNGDVQLDLNDNFSSFEYKALSEVDDSSTDMLNEFVDVSKEDMEILEKSISQKSLNIDQIEEQVVENVQPIDKFPVAADDFVHIEQENTSVCSNIPSYLLEDSASESEPGKYQYSIGGFEKRDEEVRAAVLKRVTDGLLKNAKLCDKEPMTNHNSGLMPFDLLECCKAADEAFARLDKAYPIQKTVWPFIWNKISTILIGCTEFYPQLLYLPVVCGLIQSIQNDRNRKVIIVTSNQTQANVISRMSACYLEDRTPSNLVYSNAEEYRNHLNEKKFRECNIFVTLPSWIIKNEGKCPKNALCFIVNDFEAIPANHRTGILNIVKRSKAQFIITSNHYVDEVKQIMFDVPDVFISLESHYDLFHLAVKPHQSRSTTLDLIESKCISTENAVFELRKLLIKVNKRTVVVCRDPETAKTIGEMLKNKFNLNIVLNEKPKLATQIFVCSDDQLMGFGVRTADHIIHYDLPDDFDTFSLRYSVFTLSHCRFQTMASSGIDSQSPSAKILLMLNNARDLLGDRRLLTLLSLITRGNTLSTLPKTKSKLLELARNMNENESLCPDIAAHFTRIDHMLNCKNRHSQSARTDPEWYRFSWGSSCKVEILDVLSPICFTVRILEHKNKCGVWRPLKSDSLEEISECLNTFYAKSFEPVQNTAELSKTNMYVMRDGMQYWRCQILDVEIDNVPGEIRVKLVDLGKPRRPNIRDIGYLKETHALFPIQPVNLCLLKLVPWNNRCWNDDDTAHVRGLIFRTNPHNDTFGNGIFEITIESELNSNVIYATNLINRHVDSDKNEDYASLLISKGIATRTTEVSTEFMKRL